MLVFPGITQLDLTGPFEVFSRAPGTEVRLIWKDKNPVESDTGLLLMPQKTFGEAGDLDLLCIPGGPGINDLLTDDDTLAFVNHHAMKARFISSVCTGALLLGAAGALQGKRATTHWMSLDLLSQFGAQAVEDRVVQDGRLITGGGVTAGIDFALAVVAEIFGRPAAEKIQLAIQYDPKPPFSSGSPQAAPAQIVDAVMAASRTRQQARREACAVAADRLNRKAGAPSGPSL